VGIARLLGAAAACALIGTVGAARIAAARPGSDQEQDPAYWVERMEQALLPGASLRTDLVLENPGRPRSEARQQMRLIRVEGPSRIRSVVEVESPPAARRVLRISSQPGGRVERVVFSGAGEPITLHAERQDRFLDSVFSYEDLGFVALDHRADHARVAIEELSGGRTVRLETGAYGPYGKVITLLDADTALPRKVEFYDSQGHLVRTVGYGQVDRSGAYAFPLEVEAVELATGRRSRVRFQHVELGASVYEHEFGDLRLRQVLEDLQRAGLERSSTSSSGGGGWIREPDAGTGS
jgi:hypothetical protein